ncbi:MAG: DUF4252 domain-containing protein [Flavobacteriaceae bacterium]
MKNRTKKIALVFMAAAILMACSSTKSLQEYYVDNAENPNFLSFDVPASMMNLEKIEMGETQKEALRSLKKLNIIAFRKTEINGAEYKVEKENVNAILKNSKYTELMKMNTEFGKATVKFLGDDDAIDEVIIYGNNDDKGFALVRVLGNNMNPAHMAQLLEVVQKSDFKGEGLDKLGDLFKD